MEWIEADPLPLECENCPEEECYNCEYAAERWYLSREDELRVRRKLLLKSIERLQKQLRVIDEELTQIKK